MASKKSDNTLSVDTIVALATPPGRGGIGVIRLSGPLSATIARTLLGKMPPPRYATHTAFLGDNNAKLDDGIALFFPAPHSFTGEDVLELQGHGGPIVLDTVIERCLHLGARMARPGEFSERAFLNNKIDLVQAEAVADLINADSRQAARAALNSLSGAFSAAIGKMQTQLTHLRLQIEASLDFSDDDIPLISPSEIQQKLSALLTILSDIQQAARQGHILQEGMTVVLAGAPNAGKSSLINQLTGEDAAIVTDIPGTTRDTLHSRIHIDGMPLHIIDTAGLRDSIDPIEQAGMARTHAAMEKADAILWLYDITARLPTQKKIITGPELSEAALTALPLHLRQKTLLVVNKIDLYGDTARICPPTTSTQHSASGHMLLTHIYLSAKTAEGIDLLKTCLKQRMHYESNTAGLFSARRRHLNALEDVLSCLNEALEAQATLLGTECVAEALRQAQLALSSITGEVHADDLLGDIFSSFCIGK